MLPEQMLPGQMLLGQMSVTVKILMPKSLCGGWWVVVCKPILVFSLSLCQAEQKVRSWTTT